jgi:NADH dehydrogenase
MADKDLKRIIILGGGFAGMYCALELEKRLARRSDIQITLISKENFFLFTPMLHEVAASDLDLTHIVNPVRKLLKRISFFDGTVESIDLNARTITVYHGHERHLHVLEYDHIVLALGSVTNFFALNGVEKNARTMKSLSDAIGLRNHLIQNIEEADFECCPRIREPLLNFVIAGGGFAGVETIAAINDFLHDALRYYPNLRPEMLRFVLVHPQKYILPELSASLGEYARRKLEERGIEIRLETSVKCCDERTVTLSDGSVVTSNTLIWTAGTAPHPVLATLPCEKERGRVLADEFMQVVGWPGVWALGDCAMVPDLTTGKMCPPTAQHALRQGRVLARNIEATIDGGHRVPFRFKAIGQLAAIGKRTGVAQILGINFSGFIAWWLWRTIYLSKLPRFEKKVRVALDWTLDLLFTKDLVRFMSSSNSAAARGAFESAVEERAKVA